MKSLSDYTKILRDTATNLNLHGESVEMVVQMLANALYVSEVEHITYSQEASLERATLENSKIQHCVNQMYSVYRGANPRVILHIKASKLFQFNPHDEIIRSNNFKVYYLGYYDSDTSGFVYSSSTVYPDTEITIEGLIASETYTSDWTISGNTYYQSFPESNLSSDLYLIDKTNDTEVEVSRLFYDHLRKNVFFDLTLPGYGCRIYYPETYRGLLRENLTNLELSLSVYKYYELSGATDSEKKALKIDGATLVSFSEELLDKLGAQEDYPGIIYISETSRDGVDTIHHKANKNRYTGTYLSTNSDLSFLLEEYYPEKIKSSGVTYRFEAPDSSTLETVTKTYIPDFGNITAGNKSLVVGYSNLKSALSGWVNSGLGYIPQGDLKFSYCKSKSSGSSNLSLDLITTSSILPATISGTTVTATLENIGVKVLINNDGITSLLTTRAEIEAAGYVVVYKYTNGAYVVVTSGTEIQIPVQVQTSTNYGLTIYLLPGSYVTSGSLVDGWESKVLDTETLPAVITPLANTKTDTSTTTGEDGSQTSTTTTTTIDAGSNYFGLNLKDDTLYIQTDYEGNFISTTGVSTKATFYYNGSKPAAGEVTYSYIPVSDITCTVDSTTGDIVITGMSETKNIGYLTITAEYNGTFLTETLTIKKSISNLSDDDKPITFMIYGDNGGTTDILISTLVASGDTKEYDLEIPENTYKNIYILTSAAGIEFSEASFVYRYNVINNIISGDQYLTPSLVLYYIPYTNSNLLSQSEKDSFIENNKTYYITQDINIKEGTEYTARFEVNLDLYSNSTLDDTILELLDGYSYKFGQDLGDENNQTELYTEIKSLITKISDVRFVNSLKIVYYDALGRQVSYDDIKDSLDITYFDINCNVLSTITS